MSDTMGTTLRIVVDTNVLIAGVRSRRGTSFVLLSEVGMDRFDIALSVPLVFEYEEVLLRHLPATDLGADDVDGLLDYLCSVARLQEIFFLWRPLLVDPKDDLILELAVASRSDAIVTFNERDFRGAEQFGIRVLTPAKFLKEIGVL